VNDLKKCFGQLKEKQQQNKITLFYKIRDIAEHLKAQSEAELGRNGRVS